MGIALAQEMTLLGAEVTLVLGPIAETSLPENIKVIKVQSAQQMLQACLSVYESQDMVIAAAAVADYRPEVVATEKIKKHNDSFTLQLVKNPDILFTLGQQKTKQFLVGFALETHNEIENAQKKLQAKNLDLMVLNSLQDEGAGFAKNTNKITFITKDLVVEPMPLKSKTQVAVDIINKILSLRNE